MGQKQSFFIYFLFIIFFIYYYHIFIKYYYQIFIIKKLEIKILIQNYIWIQRKIIFIIFFIFFSKKNFFSQKKKNTYIYNQNYQSFLKLITIKITITLTITIKYIYIYSQIIYLLYIANILCTAKSILIFSIEYFVFVFCFSYFINFINLKNGIIKNWLIEWLI